MSLQSLILAFCLTIRFVISVDFLITRVSTCHVDTLDFLIQLCIMNIGRLN